MGGPVEPMNDQMRELAKAVRKNDWKEASRLTKGLRAAQVYRAMSPFAEL